MLTWQGACETRRIIFRVPEFTSLALYNHFSFLHVAVSEEGVSPSSQQCGEEGSQE